MPQNSGLPPMGLINQMPGLATKNQTGEMPIVMCALQGSKKGWCVSWCLDGHGRSHGQVGGKGFLRRWD